MINFPIFRGEMIINTSFVACRHVAVLDNGFISRLKRVDTIINQTDFGLLAAVQKTTPIAAAALLIRAPRTDNAKYILRAVLSAEVVINTSVEGRGRKTKEITAEKKNQFSFGETKLSAAEKKKTVSNTIYYNNTMTGKREHREKNIMTKYRKSIVRQRVYRIW